MLQNKKQNTMDIKEFVSRFKTHPILFIGSGLSRRYLKDYPDWHGLLSTIAIDIWGDDSKYLELAERFTFDPLQIANEYEKLFKEEVKTNPKFSNIKVQNDQNIRRKTLISPFKIYLSEIFSQKSYLEDKREEIEMFKSLQDSIKSIVTTNYDGMLEDIFNFDKLVGNDILLSNQYGTIYKIHGCYTEPSKIIFTQDDYEKYKEHNKLIISQLISLFIHNPVIFMGYGNDDENVNFVLETIYTYVGNNQPLRDRIKNNFLVVEYAQNSINKEVSDFDKTLETGVHLSFNKIATDNYTAIYEAIKDQPYAIESGLLRLVDDLMQRVFVDSKNKENAQIIHYIIEDIKQKNPNIPILGALNGKVEENVVYKDTKVNVSQDYFIENYFEILAKKDIVTIKLIDSLKPKVAKKSFFPIFGFTETLSKKEDSLKSATTSRLKDIQEKALENYAKKITVHFKSYTDIESVHEDEEVSNSSKHQCVFLNIWSDSISLTETEKYLKEYTGNKNNTDFRRLVTLYDYKKYSTSTMEADEEDLFLMITP